MGLVERLRCSKVLTYLSICLEAGVWNYKVGVKNSKLSHVTGNLSRLMSKPTKWVCAQRRLRSAWASAQSDQSLRCPHEETLIPKLPNERTAKTLIRLGGCPGWSESSLGHSHTVGFVTRRLLCDSSCIRVRDEALYLKAGPGSLVGCGPPGIQTVAGLILETGSILCGDWSWNHFYSHSLPTTDSSRAVVSYWWKDVH